jgi:hypothetical protein
MSTIAFLRLKKLKGASIIKTAARHNRREIAAELGADGHISPERSPLNFSIAGAVTADAVATLADERVKSAGLAKLPKNCVRALELVFSLPSETCIDLQEYFGACVAWAAERFGGPNNVLAADVHRDETQPHCHLLMLPLIDGRMVGSDLMGGPQVLAAHLSSFHEAVAGRYGLNRAPARLSGHRKDEAIAAILQSLRQRNDAVLRSVGWATVRDGIERDPSPWLDLLGLAVPSQPAKRMKSMTEIFISPGKGPKREPAPRNPKGFAPPEKTRTLSCVGFAPPQSPAPAEPDAPLAASTQPVMTRERDSDRSARQWSEELGEFIEAPTPAQRSARKEAEFLVASALVERQQHASRPPRR